MARKISVELVGDSRSLERSFSRAERSAHGFNKTMTGASRTAKTHASVLGGLGRAVGLAGGLVGFAGLAGAVRSSWEELQQSAKAAAQTNAVLRSTGGAAHVTRGQVDALAKSLLNKSGVDDETIKSGENMLLTFTKIRNEAGKGNDVFTRASKATLDMATAMTHGNVTQENLAKTSILVGKALNDPVKGMTSLRRVGVAFDNEQTTFIKSLVEGSDALTGLGFTSKNVTLPQLEILTKAVKAHVPPLDALKLAHVHLDAGQLRVFKHMTEGGHVLEAQRKILTELNKEFGGSAAAMGRTLPGKISILRENLKNLGAAMLTVLVPAISRVVGRMTKWLGNTQNQQKILTTFRELVRSVSHVLHIAAAAFTTVSHRVGGARNTIKLLIGALVAYKAVKVTSSIYSTAAGFARMAGNAGRAARAVRIARLSSFGLSAGLIGKGGLVLAAGAAAFALTTLFLKVTGLDKRLRAAGGAAYGLASKLGLVNDKMKQYDGKVILGQKGTLRARAALGKLEAGGLTPQQAAEAYVRKHPNVALHDAQVLAGVYSPSVAKRDIVIYLQLDGKTIAKHTTKEQHRHNKRNTKPRSGR